MGFKCFALSAKLADWVVERRYISSQMDFSLFHVFREANSMAGLLAKDGVSRADLVFVA